MKRAYYDLDDGQISAIHFGPTGLPRIVFCHGNGYNGQTFRRVLEALNVPAIALDLRGHGQSCLPLPERRTLSSFDPFARDIGQFLNDHIETPVLVAGHSMGAVSAILASEYASDKYAGYVGFDPVSLPMSARLMSSFAPMRAQMMKRFVLAKKAGNRRRVFDSVDAVVERYTGRGAFKATPPDMLRDYVVGGTRDVEGGVELTCDPKFEQAVYAAQSHNLYRAAQHLPKNSRAIFAGIFGPSNRATRAKLGRVIGPENIEFHKERTHFFPLEDPDFAVAKLKEGLAKL